MVQSSQPEKAEKGRINFRSFLPPTLILIFALALRLWGITWSLPDEHHFLTYHPDEGVNLISGVHDKGVPRPHLDLDRFYNYGGLYFYLWQGAVAINGSYGFVQQPEHFQANTPPSMSMAAMLLTGRLLTAVLGALTAWAVWAFGKKLFGNWVGIAAGLLHAIIPATVIHGHYATVDVPATFFVTISLVYAAHLLDREEPETKRSRMKTLILAGLFSGLAAATKYNSVLVMFAPLSAAFLSSRKLYQPSEAPAEPGPLPSVSIVLATTFAGFFLGFPGVLVNPSGFWKDFSFELAKSREGMGILFAGTGNGWIYHFTNSMRFGLGLPLQLLTLAAIVYAFARRTKKDWVLLAFFVPYYLLIGWAQVRFLRYIIPLTPVIAVLVARLVLEPRTYKPIVGRIWLGLGATAAVVALLISLGMDRVMTMIPAQDQAYAYIQSNVPKGSGIAFVTAPWYYMPPLSPFFTAPATGEAHARFAREVTEYQLHPPNGEEWDPSVLQPMLPDYFVVSDIESEDAKRINLPAAQPFFKLFAESYQPTVFENQPSIFGINIGKRDYLPNDWLYPYPRITVYKRK